MTNAEKIEKLLGEIHALLLSEEQEEILIEFPCKVIVKECDEPVEMTWSEATEKFGPNGTDKKWRLPTRLESYVMYENREKIPALDHYYYWSSSEVNTNVAWIQRFSDGYQFSVNKPNYYSVRCVRR